jgi:hypothetical protein
MVLRNVDETWKTKCILCWKEAEDKPYGGADYYILHLERQLEDQGSGFVAHNFKKFLKLCHPDLHRNSPDSNEITRWLIEKYQDRLPI